MKSVHIVRYAVFIINYSYCYVLDVKASFGQIGIANHKQGRYYSDSGGLFMVTATFHVKTEILVVPGN